MVVNVLEWVVLVVDKMERISRRKGIGYFEFFIVRFFRFVDFEFGFFRNW